MEETKKLELNSQLSEVVDKEKSPAKDIEMVNINAAPGRNAPSMLPEIGSRHQTNLNEGAAQEQARLERDQAAGIILSSAGNEPDDDNERKQSALGSEPTQIVSKPGTAQDKRPSAATEEMEFEKI